MQWIEFFAMDLTMSWRMLNNKVEKHKAYAVWSIILGIVAAWVIIQINDFIQSETVDVNFINEGRLLYLTFLFFLMKSSFEFQREYRVLRRSILYE